MGLFNELFTWWNGNTIGTRFFTWRKGKRIGEDEYGNVYYEQRRGVGPLGVPRRWVIYNGLAEASLVPANWHGWLHYKTDDVPRPLSEGGWQKNHEPNLTGTSRAYKPYGKDIGGQAKATPTDYQPWRP